MNANSSAACAICNTARGMSKEGMNGMDICAMLCFAALVRTGPFLSFPLVPSEEDGRDELVSLYWGRVRKEFILFARIISELEFVIRWHISNLILLKPQTWDSDSNLLFTPVNLHQAPAGSYPSLDNR